MIIVSDHPNVTKAAGYGAAGLSAAVLGYLAISKGKDLLTGAGKIKDVLTSGPLGKFAGPVPVYVVNKRLSLVDLPGGVKDPNAGAPPVGSKLLFKLGTAAKWAGGATIAGAAGYGVGALLNEGFGWGAGKISGGKYKGEGWLGDALYDNQHKTKKPINEVNGLPSKMPMIYTDAYKKAEAAPNKGLIMTADKISNGAVKGEGWLENLLSDFLHKAENPTVKNDINLNINIDKDGRVIADSGNSGTDMTIKLMRGDFFVN